MLTGCRRAGVPNIKWWGEYQNHYVLVMDLLGPSLLELYERCRRSFTIQTTAMLAIQMIDRIEALHKAGYVHCDVKPENFVMGLPSGNEEVVHVIDLGKNYNHRAYTHATIVCYINSGFSHTFITTSGLSTSWRMPGTGQHVPFRQNKTGMTGTCRYASIYAHQGIAHARRNDMESLAYVLLFLHHGGLPWQGYLDKSDGARRRKVLAKKQLVTAEELCKGCPEGFTEFVKYVRSLPFEKQPEYAHCRSLFEAILAARSSNNKNFDWKNLPSSILQKRSLEPAVDGALGVKKARVEVGVVVPSVMQFMLVTTHNTTEGMRQQWTKSTTYASMIKWVEDAWRNANWRITSLCLDGPGYIAVMSWNTPYKQQSIKQSRWFLSDEWITKKWNLGFWITSISSRSGLDGNTVIVMSTDCPYEDQIYHTSADFPSMWVKEQWMKQYYVTAITTRDGRWAVVMSKVCIRLWGVGWSVGCICLIRGWFTGF